MSSRDITASNIAATKAKVVRPIVFVRLDFDSGVKRFHTEIGPRTAVHPVYGSEVYTGLGDFGGITGEFTETIGNSPQPIKLALSGVNASLMADAQDYTDWFWREGDICFGFDDESGTLVDDLTVLDSRFMDKVNVTLNQGIATLQLSLESRAILLSGNSDLRFTDEQKQADVPGDLAGEYIYRMLDIVLKFGDQFVNATPAQQSTWARSGAPRFRP